MTKKIRYTLIALGFVFFIIAAPVIVLYVRGVVYDFKTKSFVKTGILAVRSMPNDAAIFLDDQPKRKNQGDIRFLLPKEYQVSLKKDGYSDWNKRIDVQAGQVSWASPTFGNIYLFFKNPPIQNLAEEVVDFYGQNKNFVYLNKDTLTASSLNNPKSSQSYPLPKNVNTIAATDDGGKNFVLTNTTSSSAPTLLVFSLASGQTTDLSSLFANEPIIQFGQDGGLYALNKNILYSVNIQGKTKTPLFSGVAAFYQQGGSLYFVQQKGQNFGLFVSQAPFLDSQPLLSQLPEFESASLFITFEKEIFLLADGNLYLISSSMQQLATNVSGFSFNPNDSFLSVIHSGEFDYYNPLTANLNLVTRSSEPLGSPRILTGIGNALFFQGNKLMAIELDARDNQNQYQLYQGTNVKKFYVDDAGKNVLVLDGSSLKSIIIR